MLSLKVQFNHNCPRNIRPRSTSFQVVLNHCGDIWNVIGTIASILFWNWCPLFWVLLLCRFKVETDEFVLQFLDPLLPSIPFYTLWRSQKIFSEVIKREYWERNQWTGISKEKKKCFHMVSFQEIKVKFGFLVKFP